MQRLHFKYTLLLLILCPSLLFAAVGRVISVIGDAEVVRAEGGRVEPVRPQLELNINDVVKSRLDGQVKILLEDESQLILGPDSTITMSESQRQGSRTQSTIQMQSGWLRSMVGRQMVGGSYFKVNTPVAVVGVRGTDNTVYHDRELNVTGVRGQEGVTTVTSIDPAVSGQVEIEKDRFTVVKEGLPPTPAQVIQPNQTLQGIIRNQPNSRETKEPTASNSPREGSGGSSFQASELNVVDTLEEQVEFNQFEQGGGGD